MPPRSNALSAVLWLLISIIPLLFFLLGWRTISLECQRSGPAASCFARESFALGLHVRETRSPAVSAIVFDSFLAQRRHRPPLLLSSPAFLSGGSPVRISSFPTEIDDRNILAMQRSFSDWLASGSPSFRKTFSFISLYGYLGLAGIALLLLSIAFRLRRRALGTPIPRFLDF